MNARDEYNAHNTYHFVPMTLKGHNLKSLGVQGVHMLDK